MATKSTDVSEKTVERRTPQDRRARKSTVHFPERRTGFDRRVDAAAGPTRAAYLAWIRSLSESPKRAALLMLSIVVLNVADIGFTFRALDRGLRELNPVMAGLLDAGHGIAAIVKVGVAVVLAAAGWWLRRFRRVIEAALLVVALMTAVVLYHLVGYLVA